MEGCKAECGIRKFTVSYYVRGHPFLLYMKLDLSNSWFIYDCPISSFLFLQDVALIFFLSHRQSWKVKSKIKSHFLCTAGISGGTADHGLERGQFYRALCKLECFYLAERMFCEMLSLVFGPFSEVWWFQTEPCLRSWEATNPPWFQLALCSVPSHPHTPQPSNKYRLCVRGWLF